MRAIITKYHGPTNYRGSRISASAGDAGKVFISYPYDKSNEYCHYEAVKALCDKLGWDYPTVWGGTETGYIFCWASSVIESK